MQRREQAPAYQLPVPGNFLFSSLTFSIFSSYARVRARVLDNNTGTGVLVLVRSSTRVLVHHGTGIAIHVELARVIRVLHSVPVPHAMASIATGKTLHLHKFKALVWKRIKFPCRVPIVPIPGDLG